ncbi:GNAT family N-acetyltransferase [Micromonospora profundi]|uniref:GNAT family N-acetyltransferase n=2 Tax=Micromonospora profundi TaxID=1420889 RepID=A0AAJ6HSD6_9ACTN|nr:GNAT family N-acetyltransferase [Micromonospora profundi]WLS43429.1 GNAT family N-acetyltransferase [Micromonospora profundi]
MACDESATAFELSEILRVVPCMDRTTAVVRSIDDLAPQLANSREYWLGWGDGEDDDLAMYRSDLPDPLLNGVMRSRNTDVASVVDEVRRYFDGCPWYWRVAPDSDAGVREALVEAGAVEALTMPVMAFDLTALPDVPGTTGLRISVAEATPQGIATFVRAYGPALGVPQEGLQATTENEFARASRSDAEIRFIGWIDDRPVATSMLSVGHGVAGIYTVATQATYQRRGIATAMTLAALRAGYDLGMRVATLQATAQGEPVYRRMGAKTVAHYHMMSFPQ